MPKKIDRLLKFALDAVVEERPELQSWAREKARIWKNTRYDALSDIACSLDAGNRQIVERKLHLQPGDLDVLQRIIIATHHI